MNLIFDIGNVLFTFNPKEFIKNLFPDRPLQAELAKAVFLTDEWPKVDLGELTFSDACTIICERNPDMKTDILHVFETMHTMLSPINETISLLPKLKEAGHTLYYLSNIGFDFRDYLVSNYDCFSHFDGGIFSCDVNLIKPDEKIYQALLDKYNLSAHDCVFFDDISKNVQAACEVGIKGIVFNDAECVREFLGD